MNFSRSADEAKLNRVLICIGGGIAAYKVCEVISTLFKAGIEVRAILTDSAQKFITPLTITTLCRHPVYTDEDFWQAKHYRPLHIELGEWADLIIIAPLTANTLGKLAAGLADNLLTNTILASTCPVLLAPAMNTEMWQQQAVQRNWQQLSLDPRYHSTGPEAGLLACDRVGSGRMAEPETIVTHIMSLLYCQGQRDWQGKKLLISAGSTREHLDPVRFIGNPATGKMGLALAQAAAHRGAKVTLVAGAMKLSPSSEAIEIIPAISAAEMQEAMLDNFADADAAIMSAAVADVKPAQCSPEKLPKRSLPDALALTPVADILTELGRRKQPHQQLIGFAAQTGDIIAPALEKLRAKNLDAIVANPVDVPGAGFGSDTNCAVFIDKAGKQIEIPTCSKLQLAHHLFDWLKTLP